MVNATYKSFTSGLDLGPANAFTAFAIVEKTVVEAPDPNEPDGVSFSVRHLERFAPGTPYADVFLRIRERILHGQLTDRPLVVDRTGVGKAVIAMLRRACPEARVVEATITSGLEPVGDGRGGWLIPKRELVGLLQVLLQTRRLKIPAGLVEADTLVREMQTFSARIAPPSQGVGIDWREGVYDDLVLAVGIAVWKAERGGGLRNWLRWMESMPRQRSQTVALVEELFP